MTTLTLHTVLIVQWASMAVADPAITISPARRDAHGILMHEVSSPFQPGTTFIRVLLPESFDANKQYPVVYVLPVEAGLEHRYGDGLQEVQKAGLERKFAAIFVAPTFSQLPWYADHPSDAAFRQESQMLRAVIPLVDKTYSTQANQRGRLLLGFSKSGCGAWTLLLRNPDVFERAVAWDAPLAMRESGAYGSGPIFGTQENFAKYRVHDLLKHRGPLLVDGRRLILMGWWGFREETQATHRLLEGLGIPHIYRDGPQRRHDWHSGWVGEAVEQLMAGDKP